MEWYTKTYVSISPSSGLVICRINQSQLQYRIMGNLCATEIRRKMGRVSQGNICTRMGLQGDLGKHITVCNVILA